MHIRYTPQGCACIRLGCLAPYRYLPDIPWPKGHLNRISIHSILTVGYKNRGPYLGVLWTAYLGIPLRRTLNGIFRGDPLLGPFPDNLCRKAQIGASRLGAYSMLKWVHLCILIGIWAARPPSGHPIPHGMHPRHLLICCCTGS